MPTRLQGRPSMGLCSCDAAADVEEGVIALERARSTATLELLGLPAEALLEVVDKCSSTTTARELVKNVILPQTKGQGCCYAHLAQHGNGAPLGHPTHYVALSWDVPLAPALKAVLQHVKLQQGGSTGGAGTAAGPLAPTKSAGMEQQQQQPRGMRSATSSSGCSGAYVFIDFLCIDLWGMSIGGAPDQLPGHQPAMPHRRPRKSSTRRLLRGSTSSRSMSRMASCPDLSSKSSVLEHADVEMFVGTITATLSASRMAGTTLLLYLDPEALALGSLLPMHAAWRAMHAGLRVQLICSPELVWQQHHGIPANLTFAFHEAEESDVFLRDALLCDIDDTVYATTSGSSVGSAAHSVTSEAVQRYTQQLLLEAQALWRYLLRSALLDDKQAEGHRDADSVVHLEFIRATLLGLDGQYVAAKGKLLEVLSLLELQQREQSVNAVPVLCMLAHVQLQQGHLLDAQKHATQALIACKTANPGLTTGQVQARACHTLVLEALQQGNQAEEAWRSTYIELDQQLGPRHPLTLQFMGSLGRLLSKTRGRQEEGAMLLTECLRGTARLSAGPAPTVSATASCLTLPYQAKQPPSQPQHTVGARKLRLYVARLSMDLAVVLDQLSAASPGDNASPLFGCHCSDQIVAAFQNMEDPMGGACALGGGPKNEADSLWGQALRLIEACCGSQHEASCLSRAQWAAEKALAGVLHSVSGNHSTPRNGDAIPNASPTPVIPLQPELQAKEALQALKAEVFLLRQTLGTAHHACTLEGHVLLAHALYAAGMAAEAELTWRLVVQGRRQLLGEDSLHLAKALSGLSTCLAHQAKVAEAAEHAAAVSKATAAATGALSMQTGMALMVEADMHRAGGNLQAAEAALEHAVEVYRHCYGMTNWRTKQVYAAQAEVLEAQGRTPEAAELRTKYKIKVFV